MITNIDKLCATAIAATAEADGPLAPAETTFRERFYELIVLGLGNLFHKAPTTGNIYDRTTLVRVIEGMDDNDAANLGKRADDWLRLEGLIKQEEGKRAYFLPLKTQAVLSTATSSGLLGDVMGKILQRYLVGNPSATLRNATIALAAASLILLNDA